MTTTYNVGSVFFAKDMVFGWCVEIANKFAFTPIDEKLGVHILRILKEVCTNPMIPKEIGDVVAKALAGAEAANIEKALANLVSEEKAKEQNSIKSTIISEDVLWERDFLLRQLVCSELTALKAEKATAEEKRPLSALLATIADNVFLFKVKPNQVYFSEFVVEFKYVKEGNDIPASVMKTLHEYFPMTLRKY